MPPDAAERYADAMCGTYERCGCIGEWFVDGAECRTAGIEQFHLTENWPSVRFSRACFEDVLDYLEADECETVTSGKWEYVPCLVFRGTIDAGEQCTSTAALPLIDGGGGGGLGEETCAAPNTCIAGTCRPAPGPAVGLGESCVLETGAYCLESGTELYCATDGRCRERIHGTGSCDTPYACLEDGFHCADLTAYGGTGYCSARAAEGGACDPSEILNCAGAPDVYCEQSGECTGRWPGVCGLLTRAPGFFSLRDWVPLQ